MANLLTKLQDKQGIGLYSQLIAKQRSPFMSDILFGQDINDPSSTLSFKGILLQKTTTKDGKSVEWRLISANEDYSTLAANAAAGATSIDVVDATPFSIGDDIEVGTGTANAERKYVTAITGNTLTLDSALANDHSAGDQVLSITHAKGVGEVADKGQGVWTDDTESNFFQTFDAVLEVTKDELNAHIMAGSGAFNISMKQALSQKQIDAGIDNYLKLEFIRVFGYDILRSVENAFWSGRKAEINVGGKLRRFTGGFEEYKTTDETIDASTLTDKELFDKIVSHIYDVENLASSINANEVVVVCNNAFFKKFLTLQPSGIALPEKPTKDGYRLTEIMLGNKTYQVYYSPALDKLTANNPTVGRLYVFPKDTIAAKTREYTDVDAKQLKAVKGGPDIKVTYDPTAQAAGDVWRFYFMYEVAFIFGAYTPNKALDVYRKITVTNI